MINRIDKLKLIYPRFFIIVIGFVISYSLINYLLVIKTEFLRLNEDVLQIWMPIIFSFLLLYFLLKKQLKCLDLESVSKNFGVVLTYFLATATIAVPTIFFQMYLETATGKLTTANNIDEILLLPKTKYYIVENLYVDKNRAGAYTDIFYTGSGNESIKINFYVVSPITINRYDAARTNYPVWYGLSFEKNINNTLDEKEKEKLWNEFHNKSIEEFENKDLMEFKYFERISYNDKYENYSKAVEKTKLNSDSLKPIILIPVNDDFENRNGNKMLLAIITLIVGMFFILTIVLFVPLDEDYYNKMIKDGLKEDKEIGQFVALFIPRKHYFITPILINLNILIFLFLVASTGSFFSFKADELLNLGANYRPNVLNGEYWRLFTCMFLHGGIMHLLMNCYGLFLGGLFLEPVLGRVRYIISYLITGLFASAVSLIWHEATVSVGASGAIFGIYGIFMALLTTNFFNKAFKSTFFVAIGVFILISLLMGFQGNIDNAAHIGGLISGMLVGYLFYFSVRRKLQSDSF